MIGALPQTAAPIDKITPHLLGSPIWVIRIAASHGIKILDDLSRGSQLQVRRCFSAGPNGGQDVFTDSTYRELHVA
jgi:hypothetical protein